MFFPSGFLRLPTQKKTLRIGYCPRIPPHDIMNIEFLALVVVALLLPTLAQAVPNVIDLFSLPAVEAE